jgi:alpha-tubulin suppressor-like RCC1 family protein
MKKLSRCVEVALIVALSACGGQLNEPPAAPLQSNLAGKQAAAHSEIAQQSSVELFPGKFDNYSITKTAAGYEVVDKVGSAGTTIVTSAKTLQFSDYSVSLETAGTAAKVYRLYQAAFDRAPDLAGLGFHISALDGYGASLDEVAKGFIASAEFQQKYGDTTNRQFVNLLYANILHRAPDPGGLQYWLDVLDAGNARREQVLSGFSESAENVAAVSGRIVNGIVYAPYPIGGTGSAFELKGGKVAWGAAGAVAIVLRDAHGIEVPAGHVTCASSDEQKLSISPDCRTAVGHLLGSYSVRVAGDGVIGSLTLKVIPQRRLFASSGSASSYGSGDYNPVVTNAGNLLIWGGNPSGVLGQGKSPVALRSSTLPLFVKDGSGTAPLGNIVAASAGEMNVLALTEEGNVLTWGSGHFVNANDTWLPGYVPSPTGTGRLSRIVQVSMGAMNTAALTDTGNVFSWGSYTGQGTADARWYPDYVRDPAGNDPLGGIIAVSAGTHFTLALGSNGKVYGWGWYQAARGNPDATQTLPTTVKLAADGSELTNVVAISAGYNFALALAADGRVYAWGDNSDGQLGQNVQHGSYRGAVLVKDVTGTDVLRDIRMVSAGGWHALALDAAGRVYSWGTATSGQLGDGANRPILNESLKPIFVVGPESTGRLSGVVSIAAGYNHSLALAGDGTVYIWGEGYSGNLGQGPTNTWSFAAYPVPVRNMSGSGSLNLAPLTGYQGLRGMEP